TQTISFGEYPVRRTTHGPPFGMGRRRERLDGNPEATAWEACFIDSRRSRGNRGDNSHSPPLKWGGRWLHSPMGEPVVPAGPSVAPSGASAMKQPVTHGGA